MRISIGTFNLNNLFSRYNFRGEVDAVRDGDASLEAAIRYSFADGDRFKLRTFRGRLVKAKDADDVETIAARIRTMDVDVLAVQEVEDVDTLEQFAREHLRGMYRYASLVEGNDDRLIDLGLLSKYPLGAVTSWRHARHDEDPTRPIFGRDLTEIEIYNPSRRRRLFTVYNNHLKSHFVPFDHPDPEQARADANARRRRQAETAARIVQARMRPNSRFVVLGDMNDPPRSDALKAFADGPLGLVNALAAAEETRAAKDDDPPPPGPSWTHRFKPSGEPAQYALYDQIWLSPALNRRFLSAHIDRRTKHGGDGSDHDPAWVVVDV